MGLIKFEDFTKLDIRVVTVLDAELIEKSEKLILLKVDDGTPEPRTVVAGIKKQFPLCPESKAALIGSQIVIVANLEPRMIMGVMSHGMILAAHSDEEVQLLAPRQHISPGSKIG